MNRIIMIAATIAISGCQVKEQPSPTTQEQDGAITTGRAAGLYVKISDICPSNEAELKAYKSLQESWDRIYIGGPFEKFYIHGKNTVIETSNNIIAKQLSSQHQNDLLKACGILGSEAIQAYTEGQSRAEAMRKAVMGE